MKNNKNDLKCLLLDILLIVYLDEPQMVPNVQTREICGFLSSSSGFHLVACRYNFQWRLQIRKEVWGNVPEFATQPSVGNHLGSKQILIATLINTRD